MSLMMTKATEYLQKFKTNFFWTTLATSAGTDIKARIVELMFHNKYGFYIRTKKGTKKVQELIDHPLVTLSICPPNDMSAVVAQAWVEVIDDKKVCSEMWDENMRNYGYSGPDDDRIVMCIFHITHIKHGKEEFAGEAINQAAVDKANQTVAQAAPYAGPFQDKEADALIKKEIGEMQLCHLVTKHGAHQFNDRMMEVRRSDEFGLHCITNPQSEKYKEITANPNIVLLRELRATMGQLEIVAEAVLCTDPEIKKKLWHAGLPSYGIESVDSPLYGLILFKPKTVFLHDITNSTPQEFYYSR
ncbi:hypothetical protein BLNAU_9464 [Blattamonas nauphoetae]|uniref:General stress protein FMN-binding split barrel domain-containing protein n=1 Tax=Blattamonas nauphoetae TaxID=2049346 RepID=A0ABQ9XVU0_9EUKA|nr:hypothetical protein BLNAU_9464 [Blattamonas nauphoetae]